MNLRRLTLGGLARFSEYLDQLRADPTSGVPWDLLDSTSDTEVVGQPTAIAPPDLATRLAVAEYLDVLFREADFVPAERDDGIWAWLTLAYFDVLCPKDADGARRPRERAAYIPETQDYRRYYRHLLLGPYLIYRAHRDNPSRAMALLCKPPHVIDDIVAQIAASQEFVSNPAIVELTTLLYYDQVSKKIKRGAGGKGPGSPRRLVDIIKQLDVTWDLYAMSREEFMIILPKEFNRFIEPQTNLG